MKILCLSDLHINDDKSFERKKLFVGNILSQNEVDMVVIAGDIFESSYDIIINPYKKISDLTCGLLTICTFGNHEFWYRTIEDTHKRYKDHYNPSRYNVHYLDIINLYKVDKLNFVGNVLWYDGSMKSYADQFLYDWGGECGNIKSYTWNDYLIDDFDIAVESAKCVDNILDNICKTNMNVLVTHCVPHSKLNLHTENGKTVYDAYSGLSNFLDMIRFDYSISGHTHYRTIGQRINDCGCINVGAAMYQPFQYYILEI